MRMKEPNRRQVVLGAGAAMAVALARTGVSTAQELRSSDIMYPTHHWELLEPSAAGWSADLLEQGAGLCGGQRFQRRHDRPSWTRDRRVG